MSILEGILLGLIQGLTEFLPVSSSGHLVVFSRLFGVETGDTGLLFPVVLHLGTLAAVLTVYRKTVLSLITAFFRFLGKLFRGRFKPENATSHQKMLGCLVVSVLPLFLVFPFRDRIEEFFSSLFAVGIALLVTSIVLWLCDRIPTGEKTSKNMSWTDALAVGIAQCIAVIPGISRSGSTVTAGVACGLTRKYAAKYSFLLSVPTILGGALVELLDFVRSGESFDSSLVLPCLFGFLTSAVTGFFAIRLLEKLLRKKKFIWFSLYCFLIGTVATVAGLFIG